jgi:hypothetical protein
MGGKRRRQRLRKWLRRARRQPAPPAADEIILGRAVGTLDGAWTADQIIQAARASGFRAEKVVPGRYVPVAIDFPRGWSDEQVGRWLRQLDEAKAN